MTQYKILCIADWHLGKAAHFRKSGIAMPQPVLQQDFLLIRSLLQQYEVAHMIFLGDLFHAQQNSDWQLFAAFIQQLEGIKVTLVKGNHDIMPDALFEAIGINVVAHLYVDDQLLLVHEPDFEQVPEHLLAIAGHIHPGCLIAGKARQHYRLPCFFYHHSGTLVLPAFGTLTGLYTLTPSYHDRIFPIIGKEVIAWTK